MRLTKTLIIKITVTFFSIYSVGMFLYLAFAGMNLGKGYSWTCFEPGCAILKNDSHFGVYGDVTELNFDSKYIIGKVGKPNQWLTEHDDGGVAEGYFVLNKNLGTKKFGLSEKEFNQECHTLQISDCALFKFSVLSAIYNPLHWWKYI